MSKKTSRPARALQAQRSATVGGERKSAARPLVDVEKSAPRRGIYEAEVTASTTVAEGSTPVEVEELSNTVVMPRPASRTRRPLNRRTTATIRQAELSREEEYAFIRSDLLTVFGLTVLMILILVVLTFVIGR